MGSVGKSDKEKEIGYLLDVYDRVFQFFYINNENYFKRTQILMFALQIGIATAFIKLLDNVFKSHKTETSIYIALVIVSLLGIIFCFIWLTMIQRQRNVLQYSKMYLRFIEDQLMNLGVPLSIYRAESKILYFGNRVFFCNRSEMRNEIERETLCNDYSSPKAFPDRNERLKVRLMGLEKWVVYIIRFVWVLCLCISVANTFGFGELSQVYEAKSSPRKFDRKIAGYALMK